MTCLVVRSRNFSDPTPFQIFMCVFHSFGKKWEESRIKKLHLFRELFCCKQTTRNFKIHFHSLKLDGSRVIPTTGRVPPSKTIHHQKSAPRFGWNLRETVAFFVSGIPGSIHVWCMHTYMKTLPETYSLPHFSLKMDGCISCHFRNWVKKPVSRCELLVSGRGSWFFMVN